MTTRTILIKQELDTKLEQIRRNADLADSAKRRMIAEAFEDAQRRYQEAIEKQEREIAERVSKAEKAVFEHRYPLSASDAEKAQIRAARRQAYESVHYSVAYDDEDGAQRELETMLERAERSGDPELADAVYAVATERGIRGVADKYLASRPAEKQRWDEYVQAREEASSAERLIGNAMAFGLMRPPELNLPEPVEP